jgi:hypothetical protein
VAEITSQPFVVERAAFATFFCARPIIKVHHDTASTRVARWYIFRPKIPI